MYGLSYPNAMQVKVLRNISRAVTQKEQLENFQRIAATIIRFHHFSIDFFSIPDLWTFLQPQLKVSQN